MKDFKYILAAGLLMICSSQAMAERTVAETCDITIRALAFIAADIREPNNEDIQYVIKTLVKAIGGEGTAWESGMRNSMMEHKGAVDYFSQLLWPGINRENNEEYAATYQECMDNPSQLIPNFEQQIKNHFDNKQPSIQP